MTERAVSLVADISSDDPTSIEPVLQAFAMGEITATADGFHVVASMRGEDVRELNRSLLSALRRVERHTRLRSEWTANGVTYGYFDYVLRSSRPASPA